MAHYQAKSNFLWQALFMDTLRGADATGIMAVNDLHKSPIIYKRALSGPDFLNTDKCKKMLFKCDSAKIFVGHNRHATAGSTDDEGAHPFTDGHITLVHNGTIHNPKSLIREAVADVDSAHICSSMAANGEKETLEKINGAFALVWHNAKEGTFNIARNEEREFHWARTADWDGLVFMSEMEMLSTIANRTSLKIKLPIYYPKPMTWYRFDVENLAGFQEIPFQSPSSRRMLTQNRSTGQLNDGRTGTGDNDSRTDNSTQNSSQCRSGTGGTDDGNVVTTLITTDSDVDLVLSQIRAMDKPSAGMPTTKKQIRRALEALKRHGLKFGELLICTPLNFQLYKNQKDRGEATLRVRNKNILCIAMNCKSTVYDTAKARGAMYCRAINFIFSNHNIGRLIVEPDRAWETDENNYEREQGDDDQDVVTYLKGPGNRAIPVGEYLQLTRFGCSNCGGNLGPHSTVEWIDTSPVCSQCWDEKVVNQKDVSQLIQEAMQDGAFRSKEVH